MKKHIIETYNLSTGFIKKRTPDVVLQKDINVGLKSGELVFLLGVNGSGKSTLMRTLLGLHKPIDGDVFYDGIPVGKIREKELARKVSVVFTEALTGSYLTVYDIVAMGRYRFAPLYGKLAAKDKEIINNALRQVEMSGFSDNIFSKLSDGEKQKVLIARALAQETPFMFFDEPAAFIDAPGKIALMELLADIAKNQNKGVLLTTHDIEMALHYADKIWLLKKEKPLIEGIPEDLVLNGHIQKYFNHNDIIFNETTALFEKRKNVTKKRINVSGDGVRAIWLSNALKRKGFEVSVSNVNNIDNGVICKNNIFEIVINGKTKATAGSIEEVMKTEFWV